MKEEEKKQEARWFYPPLSVYVCDHYPEKKIK